MCYERTRDDEPRPVWTSLPIKHCVCLRTSELCVYYYSTYYKYVCVCVYYCSTCACVYYCSTYYKAVREGEGDSGGHVLRKTTSRGGG
jgi:hypothetical protein